MAEVNKELIPGLSRGILEIIFGQKVLRNVVPFIKQKVPLLPTSTIQEPTIVFNAPVSFNYGSKLVSISIAYDSVAQTNYYWKYEIDGVQTSSEFQPFDPTVDVVSVVPTGWAYLLNPGAAVKIKAYNATGTTSTGYMSVFVSTSQLSKNEYDIYFGKV